MMGHAELTGYFTWPLADEAALRFVFSQCYTQGQLHCTHYTPITGAQNRSGVDLPPLTGNLIVCGGLKRRSVSTCFMVPLLTLRHKKREFTSNCIDFGKNAKSSDYRKTYFYIELSAKFRLSTPLKSNTLTANFKRLFLIPQHFVVY